MERLRTALLLVGLALAACGAPPETRVYKTYDEIDFTLTQTFLNPTPVGKSIASVAISGDKVLIGALGDHAGARNRSAAYLFDAATGDLLHTFRNPMTAPGYAFGAAVAISGDKVLFGAWFDDAGAEDSGAAYLFSPVPTSPR